MTVERMGHGVILAENDAVLRGVIRSVLAPAKQQIFAAADGVEAVNLARQFKARLVLLDIGMPNLNGLLALEAIRALPEYEEVPIVMLTCHSDSRLRRAARKLGANDFITKPFQTNDLISRLADHLGLPPMALSGALVPGSEPGDSRPAPSGVAFDWNVAPPSAASASSHSAGLDLDALLIYRDAERKS
jgi:CheY-like chemotaxis protein